MNRRTRITFAAATGLFLAAVGTVGAVEGHWPGSLLSGQQADRARAAAVTAVPEGTSHEVRALVDEGPAAYDVAVTRPGADTVTVRLDKDDRILGVRPGGINSTDGDD